jgi:hypothetical protein
MFTHEERRAIESDGLPSGCRNAEGERIIFMCAIFAEWPSTDEL